MEFRSVPGFPGYRVGEDGSVWSEKHGSWRLLGMEPGSRGYLKTTLCNGGKPKTFSVHTLVLMAFVGPKPKGMQACHNDGNPINCRWDNLRWDTPSNNHADKKRHGTWLQGDSCPASVLTEASVKVIKSRLRNGETCTRIGADFGVKRCTVSAIKNGRNWRHVE